MNGSQILYVWEWPVRIFHWVNALCITVLFATGLYIGSPVLRPAGEAYETFVMGWVRYVHFVTAYVFLANWIFRVYWFFAGNEHAKNVFRFWSRDAWRSVGHHARELLAARPEIDQELPGHDQLARMMHGLLFTAAVFMVVTGFSLYGEVNPQGVLGRLAGWTIPLAGGPRTVQYWHHLIAWFFPLWVVLHVYQVVRIDVGARRGLISSMISGYYFCQGGGAQGRPGAGSGSPRAGAAGPSSGR
ncbi:Ni/Fe-hydrogenase, b-type cytochrome subunit [Limnochorda pilosa]|uniref:Hup-type Ni Fe-hydrogenase cytochrome b subunit n=1 Tax=Limnochorda pilosa TaxID=1555112 RepID=A0A0K2SHD6_LIMPI|nr:Ni/Fe-hydrogenase, b-type cytochrome subunit [Limnochorda pilosa]BAS26505.1 Hup-type Ni Fe-hydrogenase cytochrome b subunit [Limnochorda pilosa]